MTGVIIIVVMGLLIVRQLYRMWREKKIERDRSAAFYRTFEEERHQPRKIEKMELSEFWTIIDRSREGAKGVDEQCDALRKELRKLSADRIIEFDNQFNALMNQSYTWPLWGAVYLLNRGCSDDTFDYFRSWLIGQGEERFFRALDNPESILDFVNTEEDWEGLDYCAGEVYTKLTNKDFLPGYVEFKEQPSGVEWTEAELPTQFPKIWDKVKDDMANRHRG